MVDSVEIYTDGACKGNPGSGGWAAIVRCCGHEEELSGSESNTTNNRMEVLAAIKGIEVSPQGSSVTVYSDSQYLINTMTKGWKRRVNLDLWDKLDTLISVRRVNWHWVRGHDGNPGNERADKLASNQAGTSKNETFLTHIDKEGRAVMVDVGWKEETEREAVASGQVIMGKETMNLIRNGQMKKGDVLTVARIAGIMGAKRTSELIPLCHPLPLDKISVDLELDDEKNAIIIICTAKTTAKTGVEMEALTAVSVTALTIYDMCKAVDKTMQIQDIRLMKKTGGKSGDIHLI
jgi:cyclic pyranopterin phosphate synthase